MGRYSTSTTPTYPLTHPNVGLSMECFDDLNQLIRYRDDLQSNMVSDGDCHAMRQALGMNRYMSSTGVSLESGFHLSEQVSLEAGVLEGIRKGVAYVIDMIKKVFRRLWDFLSGARFKAQASSVQSKTAEMESAVKEAQSPTPKEKPQDKGTNASPKASEPAKASPLKNNRLTLEVPMSIPKRYTRDSYKQLLDLVEAIGEFYDSPYMKTLAEPKGKIDRLWTQAEQAKGHLDRWVKWSQTHPDQMPYEFKAEVSITNDLVWLDITTQREGVHREMEIDVDIVKEGSKHVETIAGFLAVLSDRKAVLKKQEETAIRSLGDQSITSEELDAFKRFASTYMGFTGFMTKTSTIVNQHIQLLDKISAAL